MWEGLKHEKCAGWTSYKVTLFSVNWLLNFKQNMMKIHSLKSPFWADSKYIIFIPEFLNLKKIVKLAFARFFIAQKGRRKLRKCCLIEARAYLVCTLCTQNKSDKSCASSDFECPILADFSHIEPYIWHDPNDLRR